MGAAYPQAPLLAFPPRDATGERPSGPVAVAAAVFAIALLGLALLLGRSLSAPSSAVAQQQGTVTIDGLVYPFQPETCLITDDAFVASGPGRWGGEPFVASVSKMGGVHVAFGVRNDVDQPEPDALWWTSGPLRQSRVDGTSIRATAKVEDRSGTVSGPRTAVVNVSCSTP